MARILSRLPGWTSESRTKRWGARIGWPLAALFALMLLVGITSTDDAEKELGIAESGQDPSPAADADPAIAPATPAAASPAPAAAEAPPVATAPLEAPPAASPPAEAAPAAEGPTVKVLSVENDADERFSVRIRALTSDADVIDGTDVDVDANDEVGPFRMGLYGGILECRPGETEFYVAIFDMGGRMVDIAQAPGEPCDTSFYVYINPGREVLLREA